MKLMDRLLIMFITVWILGCAPPYKSDTYQKLSKDDKIKFEKYMIQGKEVYDNKCSNCHMRNGKGLTGIIPPLASSDYLELNQPDIPCLLITGTNDTITVNGKKYPPQMPHHMLTNLEMAEVLTYINNSWDNDFGFIQVKDVDNLLDNCK